MEIQSLQLTKPFKKADVLKITQGFHDNHQAIDIVAPYGTPLVAPEKCRVIQIWEGEKLSTSTHALEYGYGVKMLGLESNLLHLYWHCLPSFPVSVGEIAERGQIVAFMGNSGTVSQGGATVPLSERTTAPHRGTHLHQVCYTINTEYLDPREVIDWQTEPAYTTADWIKAWFATLKRIGRLLS